MGIMDLVRSYLPAPPNDNERLGPNDLPPDILNDLRNTPLNRPPQPTGDYDDDLPEDPPHLNQNNRNRFSRDNIPHFQIFHKLDKEFEDAFQHMDNMFKRTFFGGRPGIEDFPGGPPMESERSEPKSLREKMLDGAGPWDDEDDNSNAVSPFQNDDSDSRGFSFRFRTPFFRDLWQSPFNRGGESPIHREGESLFDREGESPLGESPLGESPLGELPLGELPLGELPFHREGESPFHREGESPFEGPADENTGKLEDQDLDNTLNKHSLDDILDSQVPRGSNNRSVFGFGDDFPSNSMSSTFKYSTSTKKVNPDGSVETTSRRCDSEGNEEITVSRNLGEQTHTVTSKKNTRGEEEKFEKFINMDQEDLEDFDEKWKEKSQKKPRDTVIVPEKKESTSDLFSSWWKPKL